MKRPRLQQFKEPDTRKMFGVILAGKLLGVVALLGIIKAAASIFGAEAGASAISQTAVKAGDIINPINTMWVMVTAFLVFFMQAGFMALEAGVARSREAVNVLMECVFDTCLCGLLFWAVGFAFMFGEGKDARVYLSSADWMDRNFFRRIEVAFPVLDPVLRRRLIDEGLRPYLEDNTHAWLLHRDGTYKRQTPGRGAARSAQQWLMNRLVT